MKVVAFNRRARFDYELLDTVEAGLQLTGQEAKSCRLGHVDLRGAYVTIRNGAAILRHATIQPYRFASGLDGYDPGRDRTLLLRRNEREKLAAMADQQGITLLPIEVRAGRYIKVLLAAARGRKTIDKRRTIKERDVQKRLRRGEDL